MSEIPYVYTTPIPKYFSEVGWFANENTFKFVHWAFSKCKDSASTAFVDRKEVVLAHYEFIAGRLSSSEECFLTPEAFRHQIKLMGRAGLLKKTTNSLANRYTCYIWVIERFQEEIHPNGV